MSFDIFLDAFKNRKETQFQSRIVYDAFGDLIGDILMDAETNTSTVKIKLPGYPSAGYMYIDNTEFIPGFAVNRPPDYPAFWEALTKILQTTPSLLHWPGGLLVANPAVIPHIPMEFINEFGPPPVITKASDIPECIAKSD